MRNSEVIVRKYSELFKASKSYQKTVAYKSVLRGGRGPAVGFGGGGGGSGTSGESSSEDSCCSGSGSGRSKISSSSGTGAFSTLTVTPAKKFFASAYYDPAIYGLTKRGGKLDNIFNRKNVVVDQ